LNDNIGTIRQLPVVDIVIIVVGGVLNDNGCMLGRQRLDQRSDRESGNGKLPTKPTRSIPPAIAVVIPVSTIVSVVVLTAYFMAVSPVVTPVIVFPVPSVAPTLRECV
jgi:hypothetical protein